MYFIYYIYIYILYNIYIYIYIYIPYIYIYIYIKQIKKSYTGEISRKLSIFERNVFYKSCRVLNNLFTDLINVVQDHVL